MMTGFRKLAGAAVMAAMMITASTPAMARGPGWGAPGWGGGWDRHHRRGDGISGGDVLAGILILGGIAAVASAASKNSDARDQQRYPDQPHAPDNGAPNTGAPDNGSYADEAAPDRHYQAPGRIENEDAAVDACAIAAEEEGARSGQTTQVRDVNRVDAVADGWNVSGTLDTRRSYRDTSRQSQGFTCTVRTGQVADVRLEGSVAFN